MVWCGVVVWWWWWWWWFSHPDLRIMTRAVSATTLWWWAVENACIWAPCVLAASLPICQMPGPGGTVAQQ